MSQLRRHRQQVRRHTSVTAALRRYRRRHVARMCQWYFESVGYDHQVEAHRVLYVLWLWATLTRRVKLGASIASAVAW